MPQRYIGFRFQIDTNRINSRGNLKEMNQLKEWEKNGVIELHISEPAYHEASFGNDTKRLKAARDHIISYTFAETPDEHTKIKRIENILFPNGAKNKNEENDVEIVFNASKYGYTLVTNDGDSKSQPNGILGNAETLMRELDIKVMRDVEAVEIVRREITNRDEICKQIANKCNKPIPEWVGNDKMDK